MPLRLAVEVTNTWPVNSVCVDVVCPLDPVLTPNPHEFIHHTEVTDTGLAWDI